MTNKGVDATRILEKGPEYLRKQMELESEETGRMSAVEMLAASKKQYVKSQQVVNSIQEPVVSFGSASVSSNGSSNRSSNWNCRNSGRNSPAGTSSVQGGPSPPEDKHVVHRTSSKRRDSLLLYRQKCELVKGSTREKNKLNLGRRLLLSSLDKASLLPEASGKECEEEEMYTKFTTPEGLAKECDSKAGYSKPIQPETQSISTDEDWTDIRSPVPKVSPGVMQRPTHKRVAEVQRRTRKGVGRSHSDISSRYSKNFADFDAFFKYCGLNGDVIESLGKENFSACSDELANKIRSVSISTSDDGFTRNSGEDSNEGLLEEEMHETVRQGTSVIERNARIIKWLYSCKNAKESGKKLRDLN
ncbi:protein FAM110C [Salvelinus namaycush]|uniref:Protein FAM110C n=1 Tax=Salvelinus namaycush TaxID=8040 RepID=A0A8U0TIP5_SALNM|nr:protein FAM110C [Salvelinus namaycush]